MADISKVTLPSGNTYDIKDATARQMISGGISFIVSWNGLSTPVVADVPAGVIIVYNDVTYVGTLAAADAQAGAFYLVKSSTQIETLDVYDEYAVVTISGLKRWEKIGDTQLDLSSLGALAYKDSVTLGKGSGDNVLGESTTFSVSSPTITVTPDTTKKMVTTTIKSVTNSTSVTANKSTWSFSMGTGTDAETLIISGGNGSDVTASNVTLSSDTTVATGSLDTTGTGAVVVTGITSASAGSQSITVGNEDRIKIAKFDDLSVSAS